MLSSHLHLIHSCPCDVASKLFKTIIFNIFIGTTHFLNFAQNDIINIQIIFRNVSVQSEQIFRKTNILR